MDIFRVFHTTPRLRRDRRGATAVEFALVGSFTILFTMGFLMMGICQFWQITLDDALRTATRQLLAGNITSSQQFVSTICNEFGAAAPCSSSSLQIAVQASTTSLTFASIPPISVNSQGQFSSSVSFPTMPFAKGGPYPVVAQAIYHLPPFMDFLPFIPFSGRTIPSLNVLLTGNPTPSLISSYAGMAN
jgi:Flp pilus assembly protein TadG